MIAMNALIVRKTSHYMTEIQSWKRLPTHWIETETRDLRFRLSLTSIMSWKERLSILVPSS